MNLEDYISQGAVSPEWDLETAIKQKVVAVRENLVKLQALVSDLQIDAGQSDVGPIDEVLAHSMLDTARLIINNIGTVNHLSGQSTGGE